jgi:hypothetical protein
MTFISNAQDKLENLQQVDNACSQRKIINTQQKLPESSGLSSILVLSDNSFMSQSVFNTNEWEELQNPYKKRLKIKVKPLKTV